MARRIPPRFLVDTNDRLDPARARLGGVTGVIRYHSDDGYPRNLTPDEAKAWAACRMDLVSVWQNGKAEEVKQGSSAGARCATVASDQQAACGGAGQPIYFAVDFWPAKA